MNKKSCLLITAIVALGIVSGFSEEEKNPAAQAFEAVKNQIEDPRFTDHVKLFVTMKKGFSDMKTFLDLCDKGIKSKDELTRSTALLCVEAIGSLYGSGHLHSLTTDKQIKLVDAYEWQNMDEIDKNIKDPEYQKKNIPSYRAYMDRVVIEPKKAKE
jgi:hypothetical protein